MNVAEEAKGALAEGFAAIIQQFQLPFSFPPEVMEEADLGVAKWQNTASVEWRSNRRDRTDIPFVTLDPASSTDLDQAFFLEKDGDEIVLHYALADLTPFVPEGGEIEKEAWQRGLTIYGLSEKISLYPKVISQGAASLLPDGARPAVLVVVAIGLDGSIKIRSVERVLCASRAKLAYDQVDLSSIPYLEEFANRFWKDEKERGAIRVEFPQQEVVADANAPGGVRLELRARVYSEWVNSTLSLAVNIALGRMMKRAGVGLFRVMEDPLPNAIARLRWTAHALGIPWSKSESLRDLQRRMDPDNISHQRFLLVARRAGGRARYATYDSKKLPWHAAIAATYVHATAPMRRLADRYVLDLACYIFQQKSIPAELLEQLNRLPEVMERCEARNANIDRAVIDLLEAVALQHRIGEILVAEVVDAEAGIVQTTDSAIRAKATQLRNVENGDRVSVRIDVANPRTRTVRLTAIPT